MARPKRRSGSARTCLRFDRRRYASWQCKGSSPLAMLGRDRGDREYEDAAREASE